MDNADNPTLAAPVTIPAEVAWRLARAGVSGADVKAVMDGMMTIDELLAKYGLE